MSLFENIFERIEARILAGNNKQNTFVSQIKALLRGDEVDPESIWKHLEGSESSENASIFCIQLLNALSKNHDRALEQKMLSTLLSINFYKNKVSKPKELLEHKNR